MGSGIAQVSAVAGWDVVVRDVGDEPLARARRTVETSLERFVTKDRISRADADAAQETASEFPATVPLPDDLEPGVWAESSDGRCSEHAALFAASQPAPLSIV